MGRWPPVMFSSIVCGVEHCDYFLLFPFLWQAFAVIIIDPRSPPNRPVRKDPKHHLLGRYDTALDKPMTTRSRDAIRVIQNRRILNCSGKRGVYRGICRLLIQLRSRQLDSGKVRLTTSIKFCRVIFGLEGRQLNSDRMSGLPYNNNNNTESLASGCSQLIRGKKPTNLHSEIYNWSVHCTL